MGSSLLITGSCEIAAALTLSGSDSQTVNCSSSGDFSITVQGATDATRDYSLTQTDRAGNISSARSLQWVRNTVVPAAPTVSIPATSPFYSNGSSLTISGACTTGYNIVMSGAAGASDVANPSGSLVQACAASGFSFTISKTTDASFDLQFKQVNTVNNAASSPTSLTWVRDTVAPVAAVLTSPAVNPIVTMDSSLIIAGSCEVSATVTLSGSDSQTATCSSTGGFSFTVLGASDATRNYAVSQTDMAGNVSQPTSVQWVRSSSVPAAPIISTPVASPYYSNTASLIISGSCTTGYNVVMSGAVSASEVTSPSNSLVFACAASTFSFTIAKTTNASFDLQFKQVNTVNNTASSYAGFTWVRDTNAPAAPVIVSPATNPYSSGDTSFTLRGTCEAGAIVTITGALSSSVTCTSLGAFSFALSKSSNGTYSYSLTQMDLASNVSIATTFDWIRDDTIPSTPTITTPSTLTYTSKLSSLTISGGCTASATTGAYTVTIGGNLSASDITSPSGAFTQNCSSTGTYSFTIAKVVDGIYNISLFQSNTAAVIDSAMINLQWKRDTVVPAAPVKITPSTATYISSGTLTVAGSCETGATVWTGGDDVQSTLCLNDAFKFVISESTDKTYNYTIYQIDPAGNQSTTVAQQWTLDSTIPTTPTISTPSINPFRSSSSSLTLSGGCRPTFIVTLGGTSVAASDVTQPSASLTQTCSDAGTFNYVIAKSSDGTYTFDLKQHNPNNSPIVYSGSISQQWIRDASAPTVTISSKPPTTNFSSSATFVFAASEIGSTTECSSDNGVTYSGCISPVTYANLTNGSRVFKVRATDKAGNQGAATSYSWTQSAYKTIALYHFDNDIVDSSSYTSPESNTLTNSSTTSTSAAANVKFGGYARAFASTNSSSQYLYVADNNSQDMVSQTMTIDLWVNFSAKPQNNNYVTLVSKTGGASPNFGWMLRMKTLGSNYKLVFSGSVDGASTPVEIISSAININTGTNYHVAVTWNKGIVKFFLNGVALNTSGTIGMAGSSKLYSPAVPLRVGVDSSLSGGFEGSIDELRISQVLRWTSGFTPPTTAYTAD